MTKDIICNISAFKYRESLDPRQYLINYFTYTLKCFQQQLKRSDYKKFFCEYVQWCLKATLPPHCLEWETPRGRNEMFRFSSFSRLNVSYIYYLRTPWTLHCICVSHVLNTVAVGVFRRNVSNGEQQTCSDHGWGRRHGGQRRPRRNAGIENTRWSKSDILIFVRSVNS